MATPVEKRHVRSQKDLKIDPHSDSIVNSKPTTAASTRSRQLGKSNSIVFGNHSILGNSILTSPRNPGQPTSPIKNRLRMNNYNLEEDSSITPGSESHRIFNFFDSKETYPTIGDSHHGSAIKQDLADKFKRNFNTSRASTFRPLSGASETHFAPTYSLSNQIDEDSHYSIAKIINPDSHSKPKTESPLKHRRVVSTGILKSSATGHARPQSSYK